MIPLVLHLAISLLTRAENLVGLTAVNRELLAQAALATRPDRVVLDMDSSESPVHGAQEGSANRFRANEVRLQLSVRADLSWSYGTTAKSEIRVKKVKQVTLHGRNLWLLASVAPSCWSSSDEKTLHDEPDE